MGRSYPLKKRPAITQRQWQAQPVSSAVRTPPRDTNSVLTHKHEALRVVTGIAPHLDLKRKRRAGFELADINVIRMYSPVFGGILRAVLRQEFVALVQFHMPDTQAVGSAGRHKSDVVRTVAHNFSRAVNTPAGGFKLDVERFPTGGIGSVSLVSRIVGSKIYRQRKMAGRHHGYGMEIRFLRHRYRLLIKR